MQVPSDPAPNVKGREQWAVIWKRYGRSEFKDWLLSFGFSGSRDEAVSKIEKAMRFGTIAPRRTPDEFRRAVEGGHMLVVPIHLGVQFHSLKDVGEPWKLLW